MNRGMYSVSQYVWFPLLRFGCLRNADVVWHVCIIVLGCYRNLCARFDTAACNAGDRVFGVNYTYLTLGSLVRVLCTVPRYLLVLLKGLIGEAR